MNGFFKAVWYISLNPFVSNLPSGSYKYFSLTSSALMLKLGKLCADAPLRIVASPLPSPVGKGVPNHQTTKQLNHQFGTLNFEH